MFRDFQLAALAKIGDQWRLLQVPLHQHLQGSLKQSWNQQYEAFIAGSREIPFDLGYTPGEQEVFRIKGYRLPPWLEGGTGNKVRTLEPLNRHADLIDSIKAVIGIARQIGGEELLLAQSFSRSHVIEPGRFLFLDNNTYQTPKHSGITLGTRLAVVYYANTGKLLFENFRAANVILPLTDLIAEASDDDIREVLNHPLLKAENIDVTAAEANQWVRKRFAMLKASGILDDFSAADLVKRSKGYRVELRVEKRKVVFPADRRETRRLLQFLNEELFRGAITEKLYETNSKRVAEK